MIIFYCQQFFLLYEKGQYLMNLRIIRISSLLFFMGSLFLPLQAMDQHVAPALHMLAAAAEMQDRLPEAKILFQAATDGDLDQVIACFPTLDVNTSDSNGQTALHKAANNGHMKIVTYLVKTQHADVSKETRTGMTASRLASWNRFMDIACYLEQKERDMMLNQPSRQRLRKKMRRTIL
jgi:Ankyrin repeats (3 copies)